MAGVGPWVSAGVGLLALAWSVVVYVRDSSGRRQADQAERAGRMITLLESIDLGGTETGLDSTNARAKHEEQIRDLQRVVRLGAADFSVRALRHGLSTSTVVIIAVYAVFLISTGAFILNGAPGESSARHNSDEIAGLTILGLGVLGVLIVGVAGERRRKSRARQRAAGMKVVSLVEGVRVTSGEARTVVVTRILRRRQLRAAKRWNEEDADQIHPR